MSSFFNHGLSSTNYLFRRPKPIGADESAAPRAAFSLHCRTSDSPNVFGAEGAGEVRPAPAVVAVPPREDAGRKCA